MLIFTDLIFKISNFEEFLFSPSLAASLAVLIMRPATVTTLLANYDFNQFRNQSQSIKLLCCSAATLQSRPIKRNECKCMRIKINQF